MENEAPTKWNGTKAELCLLVIREADARVELEERLLRSGSRVGDGEQVEAVSGYVGHQPAVPELKVVLTAKERQKRVATRRWTPTPAPP